MIKLWEEICYHLKDVPSACREELYEQKIIQSLEKLGWSRYVQEIVLKQKIRIGSCNRIIPDIIVTRLDNSEAFVIEVKRPSIDIRNQSHQDQLLSYMRQLKLDFGLLIGNKIELYYDGKFNQTDDPALLIEIDISKTDANGLIFVEMFKKELFSYQSLEVFAKNKLEEIALKAKKEKLKEKLNSTDYQNRIMQLIIGDLEEEKFNMKTIEEVLKEFTISVREKINQKQFASKLTRSDIQNIGPNSNILAEEEIKEKISDLVKRNMDFVINYCNKTDELSNLLLKEYSKRKFDINYPFFKRISKDAPKQDRYWKKKYMIQGGYYVATSEWFKDSIPLFKAYLKEIIEGI